MTDILLIRVIFSHLCLCWQFNSCLNIQPSKQGGSNQACQFYKICFFLAYQYRDNSNSDNVIML